jgi:hypothetical protein
MNRWCFGFFVVSGFCSVLYEVVWLRLAIAQFGVTTGLVSIVLSVFMIGIDVGSWGAGLLVRKYGDGITFPPLRLYAMAELLIGISAVTVPYELLWGRELLLRMTANAPLTYYLIFGCLDFSCANSLVRVHGSNFPSCDACHQETQCARQPALIQVFVSCQRSGSGTGG